jgi:hypothetical protein
LLWLLWKKIRLNFHTVPYTIPEYKEYFAMLHDIEQIMQWLDTCDINLCTKMLNDFSTCAILNSYLLLYIMPRVCNIIKIYQNYRYCLLITIDNIWT